MMDDVIINKLSLLDRYIERILAVHGDDFLTNQIAQDVATINLIRSCEICLDARTTPHQYFEFEHTSK